MFLHLGGDVAVNEKSIIAMFDLDNTSVSKHTRAFLKKAQQAGCVEDVSGDLPKSFILCEQQGKTIIYLSQISTATLNKRAKTSAGLE